MQVVEFARVLSEHMDKSIYFKLDKNKYIGSLYYYTPWIILVDGNTFCGGVRSGDSLYTFRIISLIKAACLIFMI